MPRKKRGGLGRVTKKAAAIKKARRDTFETETEEEREEKLALERNRSHFTDFHFLQFSYI